jgi:hypothetical protein
MRRGEDFLDAHAFDALPKVLAEDAVAVAEEIGGAESSGKASTSCWAVQAAVGCSVTLSVTLKWTTRRRW